jgi:protein-tyrosine-phosphatase
VPEPIRGTGPGSPHAGPARRLGRLHRPGSRPTRNLDHADHRSQVVTPELLADSDAIFVFDRFNVAELRKLGGIGPERVFWLGDFDSLWSGKRAIIDPWGKPAEEFDRTFERIERCIEEVVRVLEHR